MQNIIDRYIDKQNDLVLKLIEKLVKQASKELKVLVSEGFDPKTTYICSGNGSSFLSASYTVSDGQETWEHIDETDILDYIDSRISKNAILVCSRKARKALENIQVLCNFLERENLTMCFPYKVWYNCMSR